MSSQKVKFQLNRQGVAELMKSSEMMAVCEGYAKRALSAAGSGYELTTYTGKSRVNAQVEAVTAAAKKDNSENNTLLKALRG